MRTPKWRYEVVRSVALAEQLQADLTAAMKARDSDTIATLRLLVAALRTARVEAGREADLTDEEVLDLVAREAKRRRESIAAYRDAGRDDLADKEQRELAVLTRYLPEQLPEAELATIVDETVAATGASGPHDVGKVMAAVMPKVKGRADGKAVNALVRQRLGA